MAMSPTVRGNTPLTQRTVHGEGADVAVPLLTAVSKVLAFIREEAEDRVRSIGIETETLGWVLTVPAIWVRAVAWEAVRAPPPRRPLSPPPPPPRMSPPRRSCASPRWRRG